MKLKLLFVFIACISFSFINLEDKKEINISESSLTWKAYKVTGEHFGSIQFKKGHLSFNDDDLIGGSFIVDMTSLKAEDMGKMKNKYLTKHLKSDDFFEVKKHPEASLLITQVSKQMSKYSITADLTIRGITKPVRFIMEVSYHSAKAKVSINRTDFGIKYRSDSFFDDLKNKAIKDNFDIDVNLIF